jgi:hypothetical protein
VESITQRHSATLKYISNLDYTAMETSNLAFYHLHVEALNCRINYDCWLQIFTKHTYYCSNTLRSVLYHITLKDSIQFRRSPIKNSMEKIHTSLVRINLIKKTITRGATSANSVLQNFQHFDE